MAETGFNLYHGKIVKYDKYKTITTTAYSLIDMAADSGGLVSGFYAAVTPIATIFSRLQFELGIMSLLFMARSAIPTSPHGFSWTNLAGNPPEKRYKHLRVKLTVW